MEETFFSRLRDWMNTGPGRWVAVGVVALLVAAAAAMFLRDGGQAEADAIRARGRSVLYYCKSCKETGELRVGWDDQFPMVCPHCSKKTAVLAFRCPDPKCKQIIEQKPDIIYYCPHCGFKIDKRIIKDGPVGPRMGDGMSQRQ